MNQQPLISHEAPIHGSHNLVVRPPAQLVGRDSDLTAIHLALKAGTAVLLHGSAGIGKTALAAHLAAGYAELPGGVLWLTVANDSFDMLVNRIARAYAPLPAFDAATPQVDSVRVLLEENRPLIVLDGELNVEAAREFVKAVVGTVPLILISEKMQPGPWTPHAVGSLEAEAAEAMLFYGAGASLESYIEQIEPLAQRLSGHPLSIYVAGRAIGSSGKTPAEFLKNLPKVPPGDLNQAMAVIMASYRMLPPALQGVVLLCGVTLADGASLELLAEIGGAPLDVMRKTVRQLVSYGLITERLAYEQPYFVVHSLVKRFAETFLQGKNQYEAMRKRHLQGVVKYLQNGEQLTEKQRYDRLALEMPSVLAAGELAIQLDQEPYLEQLIELVEDTGDFVEERGFEPELAYLKHLLDPSLVPTSVVTETPGRMAGQPQEAIPQPEAALHVRKLPVIPEPVPEHEIAPDPETASALLKAVSDIDGFADDDYEVEIQSPDMETMVSPTLDHIGLEPLSPPRVEDTTEGLAASEGAEVKLGLEDVSASAASETSASPSEEDDERFSKALEDYKADGNIEDELAAIEALAMLNLEQENYEDVLAYVDRGMKLAEETDNPQREAQLLVVLGDLQTMLGRYQGAELAYQEAIAAFRPTESWQEMAQTLDKLGMLYAEYGRQPDAATVWDQTIPIYEQLDDKENLSSVLDRLGTLHAQNFHWDQALKYYSQALELAKQSGNEQAMFEELWRLGRVLESSGARDGAQNFYQQALYLALRLDNDVQLGHTLLALGRLLMEDTIQLNRVVQLLEAAEERLPESNEVKRLLKRARTRQKRLTAADITLMLPEDTLESYGKAMQNHKPLSGLADLDL